MDDKGFLPQDGTVHPLAAYTLGFLKRLFTYESSVLVLFADAADPPPGTRTCAAGVLLVPQ